eukprot:UN30216
MQSDLLFTQLTVEENLLVTAHLRLPEDWTDEKKSAKVDEMIKTLGLEKARHTKVSNISGGEKKRLNVGNEMLTNPSVLILDEPTSGLDSTTARDLIDILVELRNQGKNVICSIHQPSSNMFYKFDKIVVIADGRNVYDGKPDDLVEYFESLKFECPKNYNPADFALDLVSEKENLKRIPPMEASEAGEIDSVKDIQNKQPDEKVSTEHSSVQIDPFETTKGTEEVKKWPVSWWYQFKILLWRAFIQRRGDLLSKLQTSRYGVMSVVCALVWWQIPRKESRIHDLTSAIFFVAVLLTFFIAFSACMQFYTEHEIITRERRTGSYRLSAYFISKLMAELPVDVLYPCIFTQAIYWASGMGPTFSQWFYMFLLMNVQLIVFSQALGVLCALIHLDLQKTFVTMEQFILTGMLLGGFYIQEKNFPDWLVWSKWLSVCRYPYVLGLKIILTDDIEFDCEYPSDYAICETRDYITGTDVMEHMGYDNVGWWESLIYVGMTFLTQAAAFYFYRRI